MTELLLFRCPVCFVEYETDDPPTMQVVCAKCKVECEVAEPFEFLGQSLTAAETLMIEHLESVYREAKNQAQTYRIALARKYTDDGMWRKKGLTWTRKYASHTLYFWPITNTYRLGLVGKPKPHAIQMMIRLHRGEAKL